MNMTRLGGGDWLQNCQEITERFLKKNYHAAHRVKPMMTDTMTILLASSPEAPHHNLLSWCWDGARGQSMGFNAPEIDKFLISICYHFKAQVNKLQLTAACALNLDNLEYGVPSSNRLPVVVSVDG
ncbi:MAG: hypothetical protein U7123_02460 [Potamolinea sp.]